MQPIQASMSTSATGAMRPRPPALFRYIHLAGDPLCLGEHRLYVGLIRDVASDGMGIDVRRDTLQQL